MATDDTLDQVNVELHRALDRMNDDLRRVEILTAALSAFSRPVPDYEPRFHHLRRAAWGAQELGQTANPNQ